MCLPETEVESVAVAVASAISSSANLKSKNILKDITVPMKMP